MNFPTGAVSVLRHYTSGGDDVIPLIPPGTHGALTGAHIAISGALGTDNVLTVSLANASDQSAVAWCTCVNSAGVSGQAQFPYMVLLMGPYTASIPFSDGVAVVVNVSGSNSPNLMLSVNIAVDLSP